MATTMLDYVCHSIYGTTSTNDNILIPKAGGKSSQSYYGNINPTRPMAQIVILFSMMFANVASDHEEHYVTVAVVDDSAGINVKIAEKVPVPYGASLSMPCKVTLGENQMLNVWSDANNAIDVNISACSMDKES